jgi:hypothetical protein
MNTVKLAVSFDAVYVGAAANGPFTVYANGAKLSIPSTGAGAVLVKLGFDGQVRVTGTVLHGAGLAGYPLMELGDHALPQSVPKCCYASCSATRFKTAPAPDHHFVGTEVTAASLRIHSSRSQRRLPNQNYPSAPWGAPGFSYSCDHGALILLLLPGPCRCSWMPA